jgi:hypothetical protein
LQALSLVVDFMIPSSRLLPLGIKVLGLAGIAAIIFSAYASSADIQSSYAQSQLLVEPATTIEPVTATNTTALAQSNASSEIVLEGNRITSTSDGNQSIMDLDVARQQYLSVWENTPFSSQFDVFIEEGSNLGYGVYREHIPANTFRQGETIVLYVEPVAFGRQPIVINPAVGSTGSNNNITTLYLINMTADYIISDSRGLELQRVEDLPVGELISHRQNLEMFLTLTLSQEQPFPIGDYILTYVVHDQVTGQSFQIEKRITIDDDVPVSSRSTPTLPAEEEEDNSAQPVTP